MERPPYELWPTNVPWRSPVLKLKLMDARGLLKTDQRAVAEYDYLFTGMLKEQFGEDEAERFRVLKPFREFIMNNYKVVQAFGQHVLFELKSN